MSPVPGQGSRPFEVGLTVASWLQACTREPAPRVLTHPLPVPPEPLPGGRPLTHAVPINPSRSCCSKPRHADKSHIIKAQWLWGRSLLPKVTADDVIRAYYKSFPNPVKVGSLKITSPQTGAACPESSLTRLEELLITICFYDCPLGVLGDTCSDLPVL